jgi:hypothetical protein
MNDSFGILAIKMTVKCIKEHKFDLPLILLAINYTNKS